MRRPASIERGSIHEAWALGSALLYGLYLILLLGRPALAITAPDAPPVTLSQIEQFRKSGIPDQEWPALLESLGREEPGKAARALIVSQKPFPAPKLVELLSHSKLAVRLGALDLLEDAAGETFDFDPWQESPAGGGNEMALLRWRAWSIQGAEPAKNSATLSNETFRTLAMEIVSGQRERSERATQRLESYGTSAIAHLEAFLRAEPGLAGGPRAALKAAEYRIVLRRALPKQAAALSRQLAFGAPDAQSAALPALGEGSLEVLPVIADFLRSSDPLVRETAVDAAFQAGGEQVVELIAPLLATEKAESVLHAILRGLGKHARGPQHLQAMTRLLEHPAENVVITAAEALAQNKTGDVKAALAARLEDPRWRVRAAAVEAIGKRSLRELAPRIEAMLDDKDQFVRTTAVAACRQLLQKEAQAVLIKRFEQHDDLKAPILQALFADNNNAAPPEPVWTALAKARPEVILECLETLEDRSDRNGVRIVHAAKFARHPNRDVAAAALRILSGHGKETGLLLDGLKSSDPAIRDAVLDQLQLLPGTLQPATAAPSGAGNATPEPAPDGPLGKLYRMARTLQPGATPAPNLNVRSLPVLNAGKPADPIELRKVLEGYFRDGSPRQRFRAALALATQGDTPAAQFLLTNIETFSGLDRRLIAGSLARLAAWPAPTEELMLRLLRDPADDVREGAIEAWLEGNHSARFAGLLTEFSRPGSLLSPDEIYTWDLDRAADRGGMNTIFAAWAQKTLADPKTPEARQVMAIVLLSRTKQAGPNLDRYFDAQSPWVRRAALRARGVGNTAPLVERILQDDNAMVRAVLPFIASPQSNGWTHWFDDTHSAVDHEDFTPRASASRPLGDWAKQSAPASSAASEPVLKALEKLAKDPSDVVRFEAMFALLRLGRNVDPDTLTALIPAQPKKDDLRYRIGRFLSTDYRRLGKEFATLVPLAAGISDQERPKIQAHFGAGQKNAPTSFEALVQNLPTRVEADPFKAPATAPPAERPVAAKSFRALFFYKAGCKDCERVRQMLDDHGKQMPTLVVEELDTAASNNALLNEAMSARFGVKDTLHQVTPAVFTQAGALVREEITFPRLGDLLRDASALDPQNAWREPEAQAMQTAQATVQQRYNTLSMGVVALSGLLDGINPCAFATIIFLLSYLQVARRTPREILAVGASFIGAVFLTYFVIGLGLVQVLAQLAMVRFAGAALNYALAAFALVLSVLSFRDAQFAARGQAGQMALQLPESLKTHIRGVIRTGSRAPRFVAAAFGAGVVISLLELACTGQVYLPTIQYMLRMGRAGAVGPLLIYNTAFIIPLVAVFGLAWTGMRSETLIRFQQRHTTVVKICTGVLFLLLTALLIFGFKPPAVALGT